MKLNTTIASAPGKVLLVGGYAVLEPGNSSLSLAVNAFVHATICPSEDERFHIASAQLSYSQSFSFQELQVAHNGSARFVLNAVKYCLLYLSAKRITPKPFRIATQSDAAFSIGAGKSGLGSSAAVTVATVGAILKFHGISSVDYIHTLSQIAHSVSQGKIGSGFDVATSTYGSIIYKRYSPDAFDLSRLSDPVYLVSRVEQPWDWKIVPFDPSHLSALIGNIQGSSTSTTRMIQAVMRYKQSNPQAYANLMKSLNESNEHAIAFLGAKNLVRAHTYLAQSTLLLTELGKRSGCDIIPVNLAALMEASQEQGAHITLLPGAGGGDSIISLFLESTPMDSVRTLWESRGVEPLELSFQATGVHVHSL